MTHAVMLRCASGDVEVVGNNVARNRERPIGCDVPTDVC